MLVEQTDASPPPLPWPPGLWVGVAAGWPFVEPSINREARLVTPFSVITWSQRPPLGGLTNHVAVGGVETEGGDASVHNMAAPISPGRASLFIKGSSLSDTLL